MAAESTQSPHSCPIKHVVVLVQENRSFDHILGWMKSINPEIDGVTGAESNPLAAVSASSDDQNSVPRLLRFRDNAAFIDPDPDHSFQAIYEQVPFFLPFITRALSHEFILKMVKHIDGAQVTFLS